MILCSPLMTILGLSDNRLSGTFLRSWLNLAGLQSLMTSQFILVKRTEKVPRWRKPGCESKCIRGRSEIWVGRKDVALPWNSRWFFLEVLVLKYAWRTAFILLIDKMYDIICLAVTSNIAKLEEKLELILWQKINNPLVDIAKHRESETGSNDFLLITGEPSGIQHSSFISLRKPWYKRPKLSHIHKKGMTAINKKSRTQ